MGHMEIYSYGKIFLTVRKEVISRMKPTKKINNDDRKMLLGNISTKYGRVAPMCPGRCPLSPCGVIFRKDEKQD